MAYRIVGVQQPHQVEFAARDTGIRENSATCTPNELEEFLANHPQSALAKIYDIDVDSIPNAPEALGDYLDRITALLIQGRIYFPHQSLQELSDHLQSLIFAPKTGLLEVVE